MRFTLLPCSIETFATIWCQDLLLPLWRGTFDCSSTNKRSDWEWAVLTGETWVEHRKAVAEATPYLPGSFDRPPQNPALKVSSRYKAWEFLMYIYGLGPGIFYGILPKAYYENFCDLINGMRILNQQKITSEQLVQANNSPDICSRLREAILSTSPRSHSFHSTKHSSMLSSILGSYSSWSAYRCITVDNGVDNWQSDSRIAAAIHPICQYCPMCPSSLSS